MKRILLSAAILFLFCGCALFSPLPPGKAPEGAIADNKPPETFDVRSAVNYMTTSLSIHLLTEPLKENKVVLDADDETRTYARMVIEELSPVTGLKEKTAPGKVIFQTRFANDGWDFRLIEGSRILWKERLNLSLCRKKDNNSK